MYDEYGKNKVMKQKVLKQAFQETDGRVTRQEITGKDGGPIKTSVADLMDELGDDDL